MSTSAGQAFRLRSIAVQAYGPSALGSIGVGAILPVVALRAKDVGASVQVAAVVLALFGIGPVLAALPSGALVDRIGERRALIGAGLLDSAAMLAAGLAQTVTMLALAIFVSGTAWTVFALARQGYMIDAVPPDRRARALSLLGGMFRVGLLIGPLLGAVVIGVWGLPGPFWLASCTSAGAAAIAWTMPDLDAARRAEATDPLSVWTVIARHRFDLLTIGTVVMLISATRGVRFTLLPLWADSIGLSAQQNSVVFGAAAAMELLIVYPSGWVMDRFGRRWTAVPCVAGMGIGFLLLPLAQAIGVFTAVSLLIAAANGMGSGIVMTLSADCAPATGRAQFLGAFRLVGELGNSGGPALVAAAAAVSLAASCVSLGGLAIVGSVWTALWVGRLDRGRASALAALSWQPPAELP